MKKILIALIFSLIAIPVKAETIFDLGVKFDCYGGSVYTAMSGTVGKIGFGIGQFRNRFKIEFFTEMNEGPGFKLFVVDKVYIAPYINNGIMELGFYTNIARWRSDCFTELYAIYGIDFQYILNIDVSTSVKGKF